jgi:hypothetical protein
LDLPLAPPLPDRPWNEEEAIQRFRDVFAHFPLMGQPVEYLLGLQYPLVDMLAEAVDTLLNDREFDFLLPVLSLVILCFAPPGTRPPDLYYEDLVDAIGREMQNVLAEEGPQFPDKLAQAIEGCCQPCLLKGALGLLESATEEAPKKMAPDPAAVLNMILILKAVIDELDAGMRAQT